MNFKKLSTFIIIFGIILLIYGAFVYDSFKPETATLNGSEGFINLLNAEAREQSTDKAKTFAIFGGVILFIGIVIRLSSQGNSFTPQNSVEKKEVISDFLPNNKINAVVQCSKCNNSLSEDKAILFLGKLLCPKCYSKELK